MEIKLEYLHEFLQKYGVNWSGFSCKPGDLHPALNEYTLKKAKNYKDIYCWDNNSDAVLLYLGENGTNCERIFVKRGDKNLAIFVISDYKFTFLVEEPNPEPCYFGDVDYEPYVWTVKKDLSKDWIKFLLSKNPAYANYILDKLNQKKQNVLKTLDYKTKDIEQQIHKLNSKKAEAIQEADSQINLIAKMSSCIKKLQQEIQK